MSRLLLQNDELREQGQGIARWQVLDPKPRDGWIKLFDREKHAEEYKPFADINEAIISGSLLLCRQGAPRVPLAAQNGTKLAMEIQRAVACTRQVEQLERKYEVSFSKAYDMAKQDHESGPTSPEPFPSKATLYRYASSRRNDMPVLRGDKNKGNRTPRYEERIKELICSAARSFYLQHDSRWTLNDLTLYVNDSARQSGWLLPNHKIDRRFVRKTIHSVSVDPEIERMDPKQVAAAKSIASHRITVALPFERVEQDAVHLPFVVKTAHGITSNVWMIHAIDCCIGMPIGWNLVIGSPSESDGLKCVESILFPKAAHFARLGLDFGFDIFGTPSKLVFDNGAEAKGERMSRLTRLDIDVMHCKSRHAQQKPFIERMNASLKNALQLLPGCTRVDGKDGQRDPVKLGDVLMTDHELERWVVDWYYRKLAATPLERHIRGDFQDLVKLGPTPLARWRRMTNELAYAMPLSPARSQWLMTLYEHEVRTLNRKTGITCRGFNYRGDNLKYLIQRFGETKLKVLVNPDDYRQVFVDEGEGRPLVTLTEEFVDESTPAYSFNYMQERLKEERSVHTASAMATEFRRDVQSRAIESSNAIPKGKQRRAERNRVVADSVKKTEAVRRAVARPIERTDFAPTPDRSTALQVSFDDAPPLTVFSRMSGKEQP